MPPAPSYKSEVSWKLSNKSKQKSLAESQLLKVGWVKDAHGLKGELYVQLHAGKSDWLADWDEAILARDEDIQTHAVVRAKPFKKGLIVQLQGIADRTQAEQLKGWSLMLPTEKLVAAPGEALFLQQILGFRVFNEDVDVGEVVGFASNGPQDLLKVQVASGAIFLIPFIREFIIEISLEKRTAYMNFPADLLNSEFL